MDENKKSIDILSDALDSAIESIESKYPDISIGRFPIIDDERGQVYLADMRMSTKGKDLKESKEYFEKAAEDVRAALRKAICAAKLPEKIACVDYMKAKTDSGINGENKDSPNLIYSPWYEVIGECYDMETAKEDISERIDKELYATVEALRAAPADDIIPTAEKVTVLRKLSDELDFTVANAGDIDIEKIIAMRNEQGGLLEGAYETWLPNRYPRNESDSEQQIIEDCVRIYVRSLVKKHGLE